MKSLDDHIGEQLYKDFEEQIEWMEKCGNGTISEEAYVRAYAYHHVDPTEARSIFQDDIQALEHYWRQLSETQKTG